MNVKVVAVTQPVNIDGVDTAEEFVAYCARVSNPSNQLNNDTADKLLAYLINNKHWSPFEMVHMAIEIKTTRDIGRQILRHRSFSFQEFSQRYARINIADMVTREARLQDLKNRQNSVDVDDLTLELTWEQYQNDVKANVIKAYEWALDNGVAKEQARAVLPEGMTPSTMYMSGTLRSWIHYCALRMGNGTQKEHREIAEQCWNGICEHFPSISGLTSNN
jgi:thymidylate synthase (FAD)